MTARIFTQGSPAVEETAYWLNLLIDSTLPICGNAAQRPQGQISNDGPKNIVDSVTYIDSGIWADEQGRNRAGVVVLQEQRAFAAREVAKRTPGPAAMWRRRTWGNSWRRQSSWQTGAALCPGLQAHVFVGVNTSRLPARGSRRTRRKQRIESFEVAIKNREGEILPDAIPSVSIVKDGGYCGEEFGDDPALEGDLTYLLGRKLGLGRLAGS